MYKIAMIACLVGYAVGIAAIAVYLRKHKGEKDG